MQEMVSAQERALDELAKRLRDGTFNASIRVGTWDYHDLMDHGSSQMFERLRARVEEVNGATTARWVLRADESFWKGRANKQLIMLLVVRAAATDGQRPMADVTSLSESDRLYALIAPLGGSNGMSLVRGRGV